MRLPYRVREFLHELATPGGCWASEKMLRGTRIANEKENPDLPFPVSVAMVLAGEVHVLGKARGVIELSGMDVGGEPIGDWRVTVERVEEGVQ